MKAKVGVSAILEVSGSRKRVKVTRVRAKVLSSGKPKARAAPKSKKAKTKVVRRSPAIVVRTRVAQSRKGKGSRNMAEQFTKEVDVKIVFSFTFADKADEKP